MSAILDAISTALYSYILIILLIGVGLYFFIRTKALPLRMFGESIRVVMEKPEKGSDFSSFRALMVSTASRVGVGNIAGVATAIALGGAGAVFWMWVIATIGAASAFIESTLAQIYKRRSPHGHSFGGPAYYIARGMKHKVMASVFAIITVVTCAFVITSVQSNAIASTLLSALSPSAREPIAGLGGLSSAHLVIAALLFVFSAMVIFGGIKTVARVTEWMAPIMATVYVIMVAVICVLNLPKFGAVIGQIFAAAFAPQPTLAGLGGGILAAVINGTKRGLFSNEAGQGTAPNAAATATVSHPVRQGLIQSLGVFVDTIIVCTATAFVILIAGEKVWSNPEANPANLTTLAVADQLGQWTIMPMSILIFVLAYSSVIAAYVYSEINLSFVVKSKVATWAVRIISVASVVIGALTTLDLVWNAVDIAMAIMTVTNLVALIVLAPWGLGALRDYEAQRKRGIADPVFVAKDNPLLPGDLPGDVWDGKPTSR